jgi:Spy/CpxP family protein refolding chaperone
LGKKSIYASLRERKVIGVTLAGVPSRIPHPTLVAKRRNKSAGDLVSTGMMKRFFALTLAAGLIGGEATILNCTAADGALSRRVAIRDQAKEKLGLTDEQLNKVKSELSAEKESIKDIMQRLRTERANLRAAIQKKDAKETDVRAAAAKLAEAEADAAVLRSRLYGKVNPILTDDQRAKLKEMDAHVDDLVSKLLEKAGDRLNLQ